MVFPGIRDEDLQILILVEHLLDTAVIASLPAWSSLFGVFLLIVAQVPRPGHKFWRLAPR